MMGCDQGGYRVEEKHTGKALPIWNVQTTDGAAQTAIH